MIAEADILRVQEWMGHADIHTTRRYLHSRPQHDDANLVAEAFAIDERTIRPMQARRVDGPAGATGGCRPDARRRGMDERASVRVAVALDEPLLTAADVAKLLGVSRSSVYEYARRRHRALSSVTIGRHRRSLPQQRVGSGCLSLDPPVR